MLVIIELHGDGTRQGQLNQDGLVIVLVSDFDLVERSSPVTYDFQQFHHGISLRSDVGPVVALNIEIHSPEKIRLAMTW